VEEATQKETTKEDIKKEYKLRYFKDRHQLTDAELASHKGEYCPFRILLELG